MSQQLRQPRLAEMVAASLRDAILSGRLKEGDSLPRHEDLFTEYQVSLPAIREAMRILETEGLISVRRGNVGGAVVHLPKTDRVAQLISMVLQTRHTTAADVSEALLHLEPICAGMCAAREDRETAVLPALNEILEAQNAGIDDAATYTANARRLHQALVDHCGNDTMIVVIGALESIWSGHETSVWEEVADAAAADPESPLAIKGRRAALRDHIKLVGAIEAGNVERATSIAKAHLAATRVTTLSSAQHETITASRVGVTAPNWPHARVGR